MSSTTIRTARRDRPCGSYPCENTIKAGQRYRRQVAFPGDDGHEEGTTIWVIVECEVCASGRGDPFPGDAKVRTTT
jgi:hypothetical protein